MKESGTYNFLTFDIEEFYHAELIARKSKTDNIIYSGNGFERSINKLVSICQENNIKATCFIVAKLAEEKPEILKILDRAGHEIASHSYSHNLVYKMSPSEFEKDLVKSLDILENITGRKVIGYRAPSWSVNNNCVLWYYDILKEHGIKYSSSVFPGSTFLYGFKGAKKGIHKVYNGIIEIPQSVVKFICKDIGFSGGFFLRAMPLNYIRRKITVANNRGESIFVYAHPYEIDGYLPNISLPIVEKFVQYYNLKRGAYKLQRIIKEFSPSFIRLDEFVSYI